MATSAAANPTRTPSGVLTFLGGIVFLAIFAAIVVFWISSKQPGGDIERKRAAQRIETRDKLSKESAEKLTSAGWVDKTKGLARISINEAMVLTIDDLKKKQVTPSAMQVEAPLPILPPDPNATEPPPPAMPSAPMGAQTYPFRGPDPKPAQATLGVAPATSQAQPPTTAVPPTAPAPVSAPAPAQTPLPQTTPPAPPTPSPTPEAAPAQPSPAPAPAPAPTEPAPVQPQAAPVQPAPAPATPASKTPAAPAPTPPATPAPAPPASPTPAAPEPAPAPSVPESAAPTASVSASAQRPPLINWTETK